MTDNQFTQNVLQKLGQELEENPEKIWMYLSFADEDEGFLGGVILQAHGTIDASLAAHRMKINPGGQMICVDIPPDKLPDEKYHNRLLSKAEIQEFWPDSKSIREHELDEAV